MIAGRALGFESRGFSQDVLQPGLSHHVITLPFVSQGLPATFVSGELARSLFAETGASVVLVRLQPAERPLSPGLRFRDLSTVVDWAPCEQVHLAQFRPGSLVRSDAGFDLLTLSADSHWVSPEGVDSLLTQLKQYFRFILIEAVIAEIDVPTVRQFLVRSDLAFGFLRPNADDAFQFRGLLVNGDNRGQLKPVLCTCDSQSNDQVEALSASLGLPHLLRDCPGSDGRSADFQSAAADLLATARFSADIRRLARMASGRLVGLALSSGAAKGFAHIGVIQVLEENGIEVDLVAGASIGAYIGAVWNYGYNGQQLEKLAREMESRWAFWSMIDPVFPPRQGFLRGFALRRRLMRAIGTTHFADLVRPLRVIAGNLGTLARTVLATGEVAPAVHASMAVPGICVPVRLASESYIDGGIVDPVPVEVLRDLGVGRLIAVNVIPTAENLRQGFEQQELARRNGSRWRKFFHRAFPIEQQLNYFAQGNVFEILARSIHGAQVRLADASCRLADVVLRPDIKDDRWLDCRDPGRFIALGRQEAERRIEQIKALVTNHPLSHEQDLASRPLASVA